MRWGWGCAGWAASGLAPLKGGAFGFDLAAAFVDASSYSSELEKSKASSLESRLRFMRKNKWGRMEIKRKRGLMSRSAFKP